MNLIEQLGGYECAAYEYKNTLLADDFPYVIKATGTKFTRPELGDELLEHRRQHNIFEPDDYIIHDGELKVFAMWSSAVEGCAYIGYAYAENGEMAHKDEFRHATDEEIKAGKRLEVKSEN